MILIQFEAPSTDTVSAAVIELNLDPLAERYIVMDRLNLKILWHGLLPADGNAKIRVPVEYTTTFNLMALIIDDTGEPLHYVTGNDKIQAELVDARTVTLNP